MRTFSYNSIIYYDHLSEKFIFETTYGAYETELEKTGRAHIYHRGMKDNSRIVKTISSHLVKRGDYYIIDILNESGVKSMREAKEKLSSLFI